MKSKVKTEVHTHTNASYHAYHTPLEMMTRAKEKGIELMVMTNHAPAIPDGCPPVHFQNLTSLPRKIDGFYLLRGAELNIIDYQGGVDLSERILKDLDFVIASIHPYCLVPSTKEACTNTYVKALENPYIDVLGHSGTPEFCYDVDMVLTKCKELDKAIEINNHSFAIRKESLENCFYIARRCAELGVNVTISTDAHSIYELGDTENAWNLAMEAGVREEQIVNLTKDRFLDYLCRRKGWERSRFENETPGK